ncbi:hypothetical protein BDZ94DRAFT_1237052 [Collybia nuda]|uniref:Uncharacterized protein n=1 Tax=Collybia nuda TaxID=64659 RepID=A0A9P6CDV2_9AGAR|nr:hypothetical protein BDZ94DRAFT_1237052 [Collybia nuda]
MSSTNEETSDSALLAVLGQSLMFTTVQLVTSAIVYGIFVLLYFQELSSYLKRKHRNWAQNIMFLTSTLTFIMATINEASQISDIGILIHAAFIGYQDLPIAERPPLVDNLVVAPLLLGDWSDPIQFIITDGVVVWRAAGLMQRRKWLMVLPLFLLFASAVIITLGFSEGLVSFLPDNFAEAGFSLSIATNVVATGMFGYIFWIHRRDMVAGLGSHQPTQAERILALLLESGVIFCLVQVLYLILQLSYSLTALEVVFFTIRSLPTEISTACAYAQVINGSLFYGISAIYPTAVISLVNNNRTLNEMYSMDGSPKQSNNGEKSHTTTLLQFAVPRSVTSAGTVPPQAEKMNEADGVRGSTEC